MVGRPATGEEEDIARSKGTYYLLEKLEREGLNLNWGDIVNMVSVHALIL